MKMNVKTKNIKQSTNNIKKSRNIYFMENMKLYRNCVHEPIKTNGKKIQNITLPERFYQEIFFTNNVTRQEIFFFSARTTPSFYKNNTLTSISPGGDLKMKSKLYSNTNRQNLGAILKAEPEMETYFK